MKKFLKVILCIMLCLSFTSPVIQLNQSNAQAATLSKKWTDMEFTMNGKLYKLCFDYSKLPKAGWDFNLSDYGYKTYIMNPGDKTYSTIDLKNKKYDAEVSVGIQNTGEKAKDIKKCQVWSISVDNTFADKPVSFVLSKGIKNGSTLKQVVKAYGKPQDKYRSKELGYWEYTYQDEYSNYLRLTIYDKKGLVEMAYQFYK